MWRYFGPTLPGEMWPFSETQQTLEPAPAAAPVDREAEARERVRVVKAELDAIDAEMLAFKTKFRVRTDRFSRLLGIEASLSQRPKIETEWFALLKRRDIATANWHAALFAWAATKKV